VNEAEGDADSNGAGHNIAKDIYKSLEDQDGGNEKDSDNKEAD
jgi:hypothetical protein